MEVILSSTYYPIIKTVFKHLDLDSLLACYNVSKEFKRFAIARLKELKNVQFTEETFKDVVHKAINNYHSQGFPYENDLDYFIPYDFIEIFQDQIVKFDSLRHLIEYNKMSEEFIRNNIQYVNMDKVSKDVKLSEDFIREYRDRVRWRMICKYQKLSVDFIKEHKDYVCWKTLFDLNKIPTEHLDSMKLQYKEEIEKDFLYCHEYIDIYNTFMDEGFDFDLFIK